MNEEHTKNIEVCPKCGCRVVNVILSLYLPVTQKECECCGWIGEYEEYNNLFNEVAYEPK